MTSITSTEDNLPAPTPVDRRSRRHIRSAFLAGGAAAIALLCGFVIDHHVSAAPADLTFSQTNSCGSYNGQPQQQVSILISNPNPDIQNITRLYYWDGENVGTTPYSVDGSTQPGPHEASWSTAPARPRIRVVFVDDAGSTLYDTGELNTCGDVTLPAGSPINFDVEPQCQSGPDGTPQSQLLVISARNPSNDVRHVERKIYSDGNLVQTSTFTVDGTKDPYSAYAGFSDLATATMRATFVDDAGNAMFDTGDVPPCAGPVDPGPGDPGPAAPITVQFSATCSSGVATYLLDLVNPGPTAGVDVSTWIGSNIEPAVEHVEVTATHQHVIQLPYGTIATFGVEAGGQSIFLSPEVTSTSDADCGLPAPSPMKVQVVEREDCFVDRVRVTVTLSADAPPTEISAGWLEGGTQHTALTSIGKTPGSFSFAVDQGAAYGTVVTDTFGRELFLSDRVAGTDCSEPLIDAAGAIISSICVDDQPAVHFRMTNTTQSDMAVAFVLSSGGGQTSGTDLLDPGEPTTYQLPVEPNAPFTATIERLDNAMSVATLALVEGTAPSCTDEEPPVGSGTEPTLPAPTTVPVAPQGLEPLPELTVPQSVVNATPVAAPVMTDEAPDAVLATELPSTGGSTTIGALSAALLLGLGLALRSVAHRRA